MKYTMVIQVLTEFQLKITMIAEAIPNNVILDQIWPIFGPSLVQIVPKIHEFENVFKFLVYTIAIQVLAEFQLKTRNNLHKTDFFILFG